MPRPVTLFTGQWADLPLKTLCEMASDWGYDGLELACWGDHFEVDKALTDDGYCKAKRDLLESFGLDCFAISNHLVGQAVSDPIDERHKSILPDRIWGNGDLPTASTREPRLRSSTQPRLRSSSALRSSTGSPARPIWHKLYFFPPTSEEDIDKGYEEFANRWLPILDEYENEGITFALEVHPTEIAYDLYTFDRTLEALDGHESFCANFDPSHLIWQGIDPVKFIEVFGDRIAHVHVKDAATSLDGSTSDPREPPRVRLDPGRGWDFRSPGRGEVDFEAHHQGAQQDRATRARSVSSGKTAQWRVSTAPMEAVEFVRIDRLPSQRARRLRRGVRQGACN